MEIAGALCFAAMTLAFLLFPLRKNIFVSALNLACALIMAFFLWSVRMQPINQEWWIMTAGLCLYWFGLFAVRIMLLRSVSLNLLIRLSRGELKSNIGEDIAGRLHDMQTYEMVRRDGEVCSLKPFGIFMAFSVRLLYAALRMGP